MSTQIWYRDLRGAFNMRTAASFIPTRSMGLTQQLNALFRLSVYYTILMVLLTRNLAHLTVALATGSVTALVHELSKSKETYTAAGCVKPSGNNPFMNYMSVADQPDRGPACNPLSPAVMKQIGATEAPPQTDGPYEYGRTNRTWYTMPNTKAVNDRDKLAHWLYDADNTDKTLGIKKR